MENATKISTAPGRCIEVTLDPEKDCDIYDAVMRELTGCGLSESDALRVVSEPVRLQLAYSPLGGVFAIDSEAVGETDIYDPYTGRECVKTEYKVGETVYPDSFDGNRWNECSNGIHFFTDKSEAEKW